MDKILLYIDEDYMDEEDDEYWKLALLHGKKV